MTLIAAVVTPRFSLQVSDRRMSAPGGRCWDSENKAICIVTMDGVFSIACTGHGYLNKVRTDRWVADVIAEMSVDSFSTDQVLEHLCYRLNELFAGAPADEAGSQLTLMISGFRGTEAFIGTISNYWTQHGRRDMPCLPFTSSRRTAAIEGDMHAAIFAVCGCEGMGDPRVQDFVTATMDTRWLEIKSPTDLDALEKRFVQFVQNGQEHDWRIGKNCLAVATANQNPSAFRCTAHTGDGETTLFMPHAVTEDVALAEWDLSTDGNLIEMQGMVRLRKSGKARMLVSIGTNNFGPTVTLAEKVHIAIAPDVARRIKMAQRKVAARRRNPAKPTRKYRYKKRPRREN